MVTDTTVNSPQLSTPRRGGKARRIPCIAIGWGAETPESRERWNDRAGALASWLRAEWQREQKEARALEPDGAPAELAQLKEEKT